MTIEQTLLQEIDESKRALDGPIDDTIYRREHSKMIELINWVLENMKKPDIQICDLIEYKMNEIIDRINQIDDTIEADPLHSELRILDWIFIIFVVTKNTNELTLISFCNIIVLSLISKS
jgi:hypothetical protein